MANEPLDPDGDRGMSAHLEYFDEVGDFRYRSNSEVGARNWEVRFTLKNRHRQPVLSGPKGPEGDLRVCKFGKLPHRYVLARSSPTRSISLG